jgi:anti-anti-sigma regulatory factor/predicted RNA-binding Zn-ribbon protein involved in translation (DUF1610 family)
MKQPCREASNIPFRCAACDARISSEPGLSMYDAPCPACGYGLWCRKQTLDDQVVLSVLPGRTPEQEDIERLAELLMRSDWDRCVVIDLSRLDTISTLLLARLVLLNKRVKPVMGRLIVRGVSPIIREILHRMHIDTLFEVLDSGPVPSRDEISAMDPFPPHEPSIPVS